MSEISCNKIYDVGYFPPFNLSFSLCFYLLFVLSLLYSSFLYSSPFWIYSDLIWSNLHWSNLHWSDLLWSTLTWSDLIYSDLIWFDLLWPDLTWPDQGDKYPSFHLLRNFKSNVASYASSPPTSPLSDTSRNITSHYIRIHKNERQVINSLEQSKISSFFIFSFPSHPALLPDIFNSLYSDIFCSLFSNICSLRGRGMKK